MIIFFGFLGLFLLTFAGIAVYAYHEIEEHHD
jgi:hypothetical protein